MNKILVLIGGTALLEDIIIGNQKWFHQNTFEHLKVFLIKTTTRTTITTTPTLVATLTTTTATTSRRNHDIHLHQGARQPVANGYVYKAYVWPTDHYNRH